MSKTYRLWDCEGIYATRLKNHVNFIRQFCIILIFSGTLSSHSYSQSEKVLKLPAHTHVATVSWYDSIYRFPDFQNGRITFSTGFSPKQTIKVNYNLYFLQLDIINEKGDTLKLKPSKEMKLFDIGGHLFYYDPHKGYVEILLDSPVALGVLTELVTVGMDYVSGNTEGSSINVDVRGQTSVYDRYYRKFHSYFFIDQKDKLHKATKPSILKLFQNHKESVSAYLQEKDIDFNNGHDLIQLLNFCHQLK